MTVGVLSAPVAIAVADDTDNKTNTDAINTPASTHQHRELVDQRVRADNLAERAEARERKARAKAKAKKRAKKRAKLAAKRNAAGAQQSTAGSPQGGGGATPGHLQAIAACESGGNPGAVGGGGAYRGKYQFDQGTWASVGGSGDPAAASEAEQDQRAAMLYARAGSSPWPTCG